MKTKSIIIAAVLGSALFTACLSEKDFNDKFERKSITFRSSTSYVNGTTTRTSYSGWMSSGGFERIDWVQDDRIRVASPQATDSADPGKNYSDYSVTEKNTGAGADEVKSFATIAPLSGDGLAWGHGEHTFYSVYPSPVTTGMSSNISLSTSVSGSTSTGTSVFTLPGSQDYTYTTVTEGTVEKKILKPNMNFAFMYASATASPSEAAVELCYKPMFTAFEITIKREDSPSGAPDNFTITSFTMSAEGAALTGSCTAHLPASTLGSGVATFDGFPATPTADNKKITVNFGASGYTITKDNPLTFTVFALPQTYGTDDANGLTISFTTDYGLTKTLALKTATGSWVRFDGGKKYRITGLTIPNDDWSYSLTDLEPLTLTYAGATDEDWTPNFKSYRTHMSDSSIEETVPFHLEYSTDNGATWTTTLPDWITPASESSWDGWGGATDDGEELTLTMAASTEAQEDDPHTAHLRSLPNQNMDLSLVNGKGQSVAKSTANCYIVHAPGTYRFPLVYGNALLNGNVNEAAFHRTVSSDVITAALKPDITVANFLDYYLDHNGDPITNDGSTTGGSYDKNSIYIAERFSSKTLRAFLVWEDAPEIITISGTGITGSGTNAYVNFSVPAAKIQEGNALIAVTDGTDIIWSWQIWISDETYDSFDAKNGYKFATDNIGWVNGKRHSYHERSVLVRAVQDGGLTSNVTTEATLTQSEYNYYNPLGNSSYYQWGRKDPLPGSEGNPEYSSKKAVYYDTATPSYPSGAVARQATAITEAIKNPNLHFAGATNDWAAFSYLNLWNSSCSKAFEHDEINQEASSPVTKTIYDPSPVGFMVPPLSSYNGYQSSDFTFVSDLSLLPPGYPQGVYIGETGSGNERFMPITGYVDRKDLNGNDYQVHGVHSPEIYYWASTPAYDGSPVTSTINAYEFVIRYNASTEEVSFTSTNSFSKTSGASIRPVEETLPGGRIYVLDDGVPAWWGSERTLSISIGGATVPLTGTKTFGSYTYKMFIIPSNIPYGEQEVTFNGENDGSVSLGTVNIQPATEKFFRVNGLNSTTVSTPASPEAVPAASFSRVYVLEKMDTNMHSNLWSSDYDRTMQLASPDVRYIKTGEKTIGGNVYRYFEIPLTPAATTIEYQAREGGLNGTRKGKNNLGSVSLNTPGEYFFSTNGKSYRSFSDPLNPTALPAVIYVLDEINLDSWGTDRYLKQGTHGGVAPRGTEDFGDYTYKWFWPSANETSHLYYTGNNNTSIDLGGVTIEDDHEYFFRTNGIAIVGSFADPASPTALPSTARFYVLDNTNNTTLWGTSPILNVWGNPTAMAGTSTIGSRTFKYYERNVSSATMGIRFQSQYYETNGIEYSFGSVAIEPGHEYFFATDGIHGEQLASHDAAITYNENISRVYILDNVNTGIHNWPSQQNWSQALSLRVDALSTTYGTYSTQTFGSYTYRCFDVNNSSLSTASDIRYQSKDDSTVYGEVTFSSVPLQNGGQFFFRSDGMTLISVTNPKAPEALPSRIYVLDYENPASWGSTRTLTVNGIGAVAQTGTTWFGSEGSARRTYNYFDIQVPASFTNTSATIVYGDGSNSVTISGIDITGGGKEIFLQTNGTQIINIAPAGISDLYGDARPAL